jgi:hypothetical protein
MKERAELESMTKDELVAYADEQGIEVSAHWVKDDIIKEIVKGQKAAAKAEAKAEPDKADSTKQHEANIAKFEAETTAAMENQEIANFHGLPKEGETREQLLARIRKMREAPPPEPEAKVHRSEAAQKEFDAELAAGKAAVAKAEEAQKKYQEHLAKEAEGEKNPAG